MNPTNGLLCGAESNKRARMAQLEEVEVPCLPPLVLSEIFSHLPRQDCARCVRVCRKFEEIIQNHQVIEDALKRDYDSFISLLEFLGQQFPG